MGLCPEWPALEDCASGSGIGLDDLQGSLLTSSVLRGCDAEFPLNFYSKCKDGFLVKRVCLGFVSGVLSKSQMRCRYYQSDK